MTSAEQIGRDLGGVMCPTSHGSWSASDHEPIFRSNDMTRIALAFTAVLAALLAGCGESPNSTDGAKPTHFKADPLFDINPEGGPLRSTS